MSPDKTCGFPQIPSIIAGMSTKHLDDHFCIKNMMNRQCVNNCFLVQTMVGKNSYEKNIPWWKVKTSSVSATAGIFQTKHEKSFDCDAMIQDHYYAREWIIC